VSIIVVALFIESVTRSKYSLLKLYSFFLFSTRFAEIQHYIRRLEYIEVMEEYQTLMLQLPALIEDSAGYQKRICMLINAWQSLCRYTNVRHRQARKRVFELRHLMSSPQKIIQSALDMQIDAAEQNATCQKGLYLTQQWQKRLDLRTMRRSQYTLQNLNRCVRKHEQ
jgi:hypothetical protein